MLVSPLEGYRLWAPSYDEWPNPLVALESRILPDLLGPIASRQVVDVACGTGRWMLRFLQLGAAVLGLDISPEMLAQAQRKYPLAGRLILAEAVRLPLPQSLSDITLCSFGAGYFFDLNRAVAEMARVTKRDGTLVMSDLHPDAHAAGWTRSFRVGDSTFEIENVPHSREQLLNAACRAGLRFMTQVDASFGEPEKAIFHSYGKEDAFAAAASISAVRISVWRRL